MNKWIVVDEANDAFDCDNCPAMVTRPYRYCPRCGDKKSYIYTCFGKIINIYEYRKKFFSDIEEN